MQTLKKMIHYLDESMQRSLANAAHQLVAVGAIAFFGFILFYWVWTEWFPQPYESLTLRIISSFLGLGLLLTPFWPQFLRQYLSWYWFVTIVYTLSFFFAYSFLMNKASGISELSLLCSVFLLVLFLDLYSLIVVLALGWGSAFILYFFSGVPVYFGAEHLAMGLILLFVIIAGTTFNYKVDLVQKQRLAGMAAAAGMIAHELRTPLLGIKSGAQALDNYAPKLIEGYQLAKSEGLISQPLRRQRLTQLQQVSERIISEIDYANTIIDMLLVNAGRANSIKNCNFETCSMADCIAEALNRYPFKSSKERELISWKGDFAFSGSKLLMQHVIFNLIKNALYAIATAQKGEISIWTDKDAKWQYLYFKDTAKGMTPKEMNQLFDHFYTTNFTGTGIGLSFCKMVLNRFGGQINCEARENEYTLFKMKFPIHLDKLQEKSNDYTRESLTKV